MPTVWQRHPAMRYTISAFFVLVEAPSRLETEIGVARRAVTGAGSDVHARVQGSLDRNRACRRKYVKSLYFHY